MIVLACLVVTLTPDAPPAPYHPTAVGTKWTHKYPAGDLEFVITAAEAKDGVTVVSVGRVRPGGAVTPHHKLAVSDAGVTQLGAVSYVSHVAMPWAEVNQTADRVTEEWRDNPRPLRLLVATARPGDTWWFAHEGLPASTCRAVGGERVTVPAGTFDAFVFDGGVPEGKGRPRFRHWYVRGMGEVKRTIAGGADKPDQEVVMTAFTPAN